MEITSTKNYDTLVLSGGSIKGISLLGSLQYLHENGKLQYVNTFVGTSVGSIICYLLCIGYTPIEIFIYISTHTELLEGLKLLDIVRMYNNMGATSFLPIQNILEKMTINKIGYLPTLKDLFTVFNKTLVCTTYDDTNSEIVYLSHTTNPTLPCLVALRMSSSIPEIFEEFKYEGKIYIDGGIADNFSIDVGEQLGTKVLGILISKNKKHNYEEHFTERIYRRIYIATSQITDYKINRMDKSKCDVIKLDCSNINFFNFDIPSKEKMGMFSKGYIYTKEYFSNLNTPKEEKTN